LLKGTAIEAEAFVTDDWGDGCSRLQIMKELQFQVIHQIVKR
jgi:hypothetical protein